LRRAGARPFSAFGLQQADQLHQMPGIITRPS
jgi:hypothetical protein